MPRSGKSILARRLCGATYLSHFPVDSLVSAFGAVFPSLCISHYKDDHEEVCARLWPFLLEYIHHLSYEDLSFMMEGYHIHPQELFEQLDLGNWLVLFLGYPTVAPEEKLAEVRDHARAMDWTEALDDVAMGALIEGYIQESRSLQRICQVYGFEFVDTGKDFMISLEKKADEIITWLGE